MIEDGPTVTHGDMTGAAKVAAGKYGAAEIVDPRPFLKGSLVDMFQLYPNITDLLPAEGYGGKMLKDMEDTVNAVDCDSVIVGTPIDLARIINIKKPNTRVYYDLQTIGTPDLERRPRRLRQEARPVGRATNGSEPAASGHDLAGRPSESARQLVVRRRPQWSTNRADRRSGNLQKPPGAIPGASDSVRHEPQPPRLLRVAI